MVLPIPWFKDTAGICFYPLLLPFLPPQGPSCLWLKDPTQPWPGCCATARAAGKSCRELNQGQGWEDNKQRGAICCSRIQLGENPAEDGKKRTLKSKEHKEEVVMAADSELTALRSCVREQQGQEPEVQTSSLLQVQDVTAKGSRAEANMRSSARRDGKCSSHLQYHRVLSGEGERRGYLHPEGSSVLICLSATPPCQQSNREIS